MMIRGCWYISMIRIQWTPLLILLTSLVCLQAKGRVALELSDRGFSHIINKAIKKIDSSLHTTISFREMSPNVPKLDNFVPTGSLTYRVSINSRELNLDSLEAFSNKEQIKVTLDALRDVRQKLIANSVRRLHAEITVLIAVTQSVENINIKAKLFPSRLKIYADKSGDSGKEVNALLDFLKNLILSRCQNFLLEGIANKYFKTDLKLGEIATISAFELPETKMLRIDYHMGKINQLNPLRFEDVHTSNGSLHIVGSSLGKGRQWD